VRGLVAIRRGSCRSVGQRAWSTARWIVSPLCVYTSLSDAVIPRGPLILCLPMPRAEMLSALSDGALPTDLPARGRSVWPEAGVVARTLRHRRGNGKAPAKPTPNVLCLRRLPWRNGLGDLRTVAL
jgi:hypothetical protein